MFLQGERLQGKSDVSMFPCLEGLMECISTALTVHFSLYVTGRRAPDAQFWGWLCPPLPSPESLRRGLHGKAGPWG